jgi:hypothetical protein
MPHLTKRPSRTMLLTVLASADGVAWICSHRSRSVTAPTCSITAVTAKRKSPGFRPRGCCAELLKLLNSFEYDAETVNISNPPRLVWWRPARARSSDISYATCVFCSANQFGRMVMSCQMRAFGRLSPHWETADWVTPSKAANSFAEPANSIALLVWKFMPSNLAYLMAFDKYA